ncbi:hypothetical protein TAL182_CH01128 [Rhizobium sp. TAL182]|uniref:hypothetical protein n=1 Tax=Rhizobium sp. TAL182 TaxID=2020313 RepID=UPI000A210FBB|nr:hypothetical protein [Rhizobium sp. TAL182]ARO22941.1 hypothetical protein TAL182_CH01128 [Rhizobium sp. TAL182]
MVDWEAARAFTQEVCAEIFDYTPLRLQPRAGGVSVNHKTADDPDRLPFDFLGTIDLEPPADRIPRHLPADPGVKNGTVAYDAVLSALTTGWPYQPRRGDLVIETAAGGVTWRIEASEKDGSARPAWYLVRNK